jgi:hypothetical protein
MKFEQIGKINPKQKSAIKNSKIFNTFLFAAKQSGAEKVVLISDVQPSGWIKFYAKTPDLTCNYWVEVGAKGGISEEAYRADQPRSDITTCDYCDGVASIDKDAKGSELIRCHSECADEAA